MKCPSCLYEYDHEKDKNDRDKEPFVNISTSHHDLILDKDPFDNVSFVKNDTYRAKLYGCPHCHTVIFEQVW